MVAQLIAIFILPILVAVDLNGIIGEMHELILAFSQLKLVTTRPNVSLVVPVAFDLSVESRKHHVAADIELAPVVKEGVVDVFLHNESLRAIESVIDELFDPIVAGVDGDTAAPVRVLTRFHNPESLPL